MQGDRPESRLVLIGLACGALALGASSFASAQDGKPADHPVDAWAGIVPRDPPPQTDEADAEPTATVEASTVQTDQDWSVVSKLLDPPNKAWQMAPRPKQPDASTWSRDDHANGSSALAVKSEVSPFLDTRVGANVTVVKPAATSLADSLSERMLSGDTPKSSTGSAWASMTGPGVPHIWDKTAVDISMDGGTDQG